MTALTTMFNFVIVYIRYICVLIFGGTLNLSSFTGEQYEFAKNIIDAWGLSGSISAPGIPILALCLGVFVIGAIIGLARRLIRG